MTFYLKVLSNVLLQYYIFIIGKNILSYDEELFLYSIYILLFFIIIYIIPNYIKNLIWKETFNIINFYEYYYYFKIKLLWTIMSLNFLLKMKENNKYLLYEIYFYSEIYKYLIWNNVKKNVNFLYLFFLKEIYELKITFLLLGKKKRKQC